jgi:hypothetical protein
MTFYSDEKDTARQKRGMYGIELEVSYPSDKTTTILTKQLDQYVPEFLTRFTPTGDSSIGGNGHGVEFVSNPQTYQSWIAFAATLKRATDWLRDNECRSYDARSCGAHIHVSRTSLTSGEHLVRLYTLLATNGNTLRRLSGRGNTDWNAYSASLAEPDDRIRAYLRYSFQHGNSTYGGYRQGSRYVSLNLTNPQTIEFRGWRGTLRAETLLEQLDCTRAFVDFAREDRPRYLMSYLGWRQWMADQKDMYERALRLVSRRLPELTPALKSSLKMRPSRRPNTNLVLAEA